MLVALGRPCAKGSAICFMGSSNLNLGHWSVILRPRSVPQACHQYDLMNQNEQSDGTVSVYIHVYGASQGRPPWAVRLLSSIPRLMASKTLRASSRAGSPPTIQTAHPNLKMIFAFPPRLTTIGRSPRPKDESFQMQFNF